MEQSCLGARWALSPSWQSPDMSCMHAASFSILQYWLAWLQHQTPCTFCLPIVINPAALIEALPPQLPLQ